MSTITDQVIKRLKDLRDQMRSYGLIMGGVLIGYEFITYLYTSNVSIGGAMLLLALKVGILFYASFSITQRIKDEFFKTGMTYMQSFSVIMRLFLYGTLLLGIFIFILNRWIDPDHLATLRESTVNAIYSYIENLQLPESQLEMIEERIEEMQEMPLPTPLEAMWGQMWSYMLWGAFTAAIVSIFKRDKDLTPFDKIKSE